MKNVHYFSTENNMMKTVIPVILLLLVIVSSGCSKKDESLITDPAPSVIQTVVTYVGSAGYVLESQNKKIIIDAPFDDFVASFQVPVYTQETEEKLSNGEEPFDNVDLFLITHEHRGHFDFTLLGQCFTKNPDAILVTTEGVYNILELNVGNFMEFKDRIFVPDLEFYESLDTTLNEIPLRISKSEHWGPVDLFNFDFNLDDMKIAFVLEQENFEKIDDIDLLFCDSLTSTLEPKHILLCHQSGTENIASLLEQSQDIPDVTFLTVSMETATFTKDGEEITVTIP